MNLAYFWFYSFYGGWFMKVFSRDLGFFFFWNCLISRFSSFLLHHLQCCNPVSQNTVKALLFIKPPSRPTPYLISPPMEVNFFISPPPPPTLWGISFCNYTLLHHEIVDQSGQRPETYNIYWRFTVHLTQMMTSSQVVKTSVNVTSNSPSQDYTRPDDHNLPNYDN